LVYSFPISQIKNPRNHLSYVHKKLDKAYKHFGTRVRIIGKIEPLDVFKSSEMRAGMLLLKIIRDPWDEFINGWNKIQEILISMEDSKKVDLEEEMLDYIFRSRLESRELVEEVIMGKQKTMTLYERALEEGELKGKLEGKLETKIETARNMKNLGLSMEVIVKSVGLSIDQLRENGIL
jgi:predicted transposase/invertase (TIGR01784 family)